jgi:hypothetical protein
MTLYAQVLMNDPTGTNADGSTFVLTGGLEWQSVEWLDPWDCDHQESMCAECVDSWNNDYEIILPPGIDE